MGGEGRGTRNDTLADQEEDVCCLCVARAVCLYLIVRNGMRSGGGCITRISCKETLRNIRKEISR